MKLKYTKEEVFNGLLGHSLTGSDLRLDCLALHEEIEKLHEMVYPAVATPELLEVLRLITLDTAPLARAYRDAGETGIPPKIEDEQAFVLHKLIGMALKHKKEWRAEFKKELAPIIELARANVRKEVTNA